MPSSPDDTMLELRLTALTEAIHRLAESTRQPSGLTITPEVLDVNEVGQLLGVTAKTVRKMDRLNHLPAPLVIGGRKKWRAKELRTWLEAGAPGREKWHAMQ